MTHLEILVRSNRSCRRFHEHEAVELNALKSLVNLARLSASGANLQPLKYILSTGRENNEAIFSCLAWAAYLKEWKGPAKGERPSAYIVILGDTGISKSFGCDHGIAAQSMLLGAREKGLAGCIIGSIRRNKLMGLLEIDPQYEVLLVLALGTPKEEIQIEAVGSNGSIQYWRDKKNIHHVPKRSLDEIIIN